MERLTLLLIFVLTTYLCSSQTYYVDVVPDSCVCISWPQATSTTLTANWDLDHDGTNDFKITSSSFNSDCVHGTENTTISGFSNNKIAGDSTCPSYCNYAFMLDTGVTINNQPSWVSSSTLLSLRENYGTFGYWKDSLYPDTKYAAVKFYSGVTLYYGWLRLRVEVGCQTAKVTLIDYAYDACPNNCFVSLNEIKHENSQLIFPNPTNSTFTIKTNTTEKHLVDLYDLNGRHVLSKSIVGTADIDANTVGNGIYTLTIKNSFGITTKKLVIAR